LIQILLMRHGIAAELGVGGVIHDSERPLTPEGRIRLEQSALGLRKLNQKLNVIFTSSLLRARQTAETVAVAFEMQSKIKVLESLAPGQALEGAASGFPEIFIEMGSYSFNRVLLVGHQPDLSELASYLLTGHRNLNIEFKKGAVCAIEVTSIPPRGPGLLLWHATPKQLRQVAKDSKT
jgi:phosphohistidine phosphatase